MKTFHILGLAGVAALAAACNSSRTADATTSTATNFAAPAIEQNMSDKVIKTDKEWKKELTPEQFAVLRQKGTERAYTGAYWNTKDPGTYRCAGCGEVLFQSDTKYDSGCGWPSFYAPNSSNVVAEAADNSHSMQRTEVLCAKCGGHLGHVFNDGPKPTGLRYCINSVSLKFEPKQNEEKK
jgi:peptide-methionine (R)-S-oxide reductase